MSPPYPLRKLQRIALKRAFSSSGKWESLSTAWKWEVAVEFASHSKLLNISTCLNCSWTHWTHWTHMGRLQMWCFVKRPQVGLVRLTMISLCSPQCPLRSVRKVWQVKAGLISRKRSSDFSCFAMPCRVFQGYWTGFEVQCIYVHLCDCKTCHICHLLLRFARRQRPVLSAARATCSCKPALVHTENHIIIS